VHKLPLTLPTKRSSSAKSYIVGWSAAAKENTSTKLASEEATGISKDA